MQATECTSHTRRGRPDPRRRDDPRMRPHGRADARSLRFAARVAAALAIGALCVAAPDASGAPARASAGASAGASTSASASAPASAAPASGRAGAEQGSGAPGAPELARWIERSVPLPGGDALRIEVKIGTLPRGLTLPACTRAEPFLPPNARLWGRASVGLRCVEGGNWTTWIPVTVSAWGPALVARRNLVPGQPIEDDAVELREVDWAATPRPPLARRDELRGKELLRPVPAGRPLQADHLRTTPTVRQGDAVPVTLTGSGFAIRIMATALASGAEGQRIGVRTPTGRVLNGRIEGTGVVIPR